MTEAKAADTVIGGWSQYGIKWRSEPVTEKCYYSRNIPHQSLHRQRRVAFRPIVD